MPKNNIKELLANNQVTLDLAFNNLLLIANVINNKELLKWVEHEISGYSENDVLPVYRRSEKSMHFIYSGLNGTYPINNAPMPISYFSEDIRGKIVNFKILEGVKVIERQIAVKDAEWTVTRDCTEHAEDVYKNTGIQCFNISQVLQKSHYEKVYDVVKFHLMKILMMIEKWFGTLDTSELETKKFEKQKILEAAKDISAYVAGLHKADIPAPRISMPLQPPLDAKNPDQTAVPQQPVFQQQPTYQLPPQQQPAYQPQQPAYQLQQPQQQQPAYQPQPMYQPQQPQQPIYQPQQTRPSEPNPQLQVQQSQAMTSSLVRAKDDQFINEQKQKVDGPDKIPSESFKAKQDVKEEVSLKEQESNNEAAKIKAAEIRKDRVPKSLLDYLEEKKTELNKKTE